MKYIVPVLNKSYAYKAIYQISSQFSIYNRPLHFHDIHIKSLWVAPKFEVSSQFCWKHRIILLVLGTESVLQYTNTFPSSATTNFREFKGENSKRCMPRSMWSSDVLNVNLHQNVYLLPFFETNFKIFNAILKYFENYFFESFQSLTSCEVVHKQSNPSDPPTTRYSEEFSSTHEICVIFSSSCVIWFLELFSTLS